jgi:hypothetical protein
MGLNPFEFSDFATDPGPLLLENRCHPLIAQMLRDPHLQVIAHDMECSGPPNGSNHLHP